MKRLRWLRVATVVLGAGVLAACDQPPAKEIAAAEAALEQARQAGADRYAAERFKESETALQEARRKVQEKDYRGALSSASDAAAKARGAVQAAAAGRTVAKSAAEVAQAEVQAALDEIDTIREEAVQNKVPDQAFLELNPLMQETREALEAIRKTVAEGALLEAQKAAVELKTRVAPLPARHREAVEAWQAAHPKGRRPAAVKKK
jgi:hypothetical protein